MSVLRGKHYQKLVVEDKQWVEEEEAGEQEACLPSSLPHPWGHGSIWSPADS